MANSVKSLMAYFSTPEHECGAKEMMEFWKTLSDEEKKEFMVAELT